MTPFEKTNRETSAFGPRTLNGRKETHKGADVVPTKYPGEIVPESAWRTRLCNTGDNGGAAVVDKIGYDSQRGKYVDVLIRTKPKKVWERHQHMALIYVSVGQKITQGTFLGLAGSTGNVTGRHLHIGIYVGNKLESSAINPAQWIDLPNAVGTYAGNSNLDNPEPPPVKVPLYAIKNSTGMTGGDKAGMDAAANARGITLQWAEV